MLSLMAQHLGSLQVLPFAPRIGREALRLHAPIILHQAEAHLQDGKDYCPRVSAVLRDGQPLYFPQ